MKWGYIAFTSNFAEERENQNNFKGKKEKAEDCYMIDNIKEYIKQTATTWKIIIGPKWNHYLPK